MEKCFGTNWNEYLLAYAYACNACFNKIYSPLNSSLVKHVNFSPYYLFRVGQAEGHNIM